MKVPSAFPKTSPCTSYLFLVPLGLLVLVFLLPNFNSSRLRSDGLGALCSRPEAVDHYSVAPVEEVAPKPEFRLLVGILTMAKRYERRNIVRLAYSVQPPVTTAHVDVRFVFCNVTDPEDAFFVALEIMYFNDIIILNCTENMNEGKSYAYFSSVPKLFSDQPYDYVMKTDDDTYLRVGSMVEALQDKPRDDVYLGHGYAMGGHPMPFMHGMGYILSWDLAQWVSTAEEILARNDTEGPEDLMVGKWLNMAGKGKNRYDLKPRMYDLNWEMNNFRPDTIAVHMLKDNRRWALTFKYFNVTAEIKPSKLYHLP